MWHTDNKTTIINFLVEKDKEAAFRQTAMQWLELCMHSARLIGPNWHAFKEDRIKVSLAVDKNSAKVSTPAIERFGEENGVEVCTMR